MHHERERVYPLAVDQDVDLSEVGLPIIYNLVIEGAVPLRDALETIVEIKNHLGERHVKDDLNAARSRIAHARIDAAPVHTELHHRSHVALGDEDRRTDEGLL